MTPLAAASQNAQRMPWLAIVLALLIFALALIRVGDLVSFDDPRVVFDIPGAGPIETDRRILGIALRSFRWMPVTRP